MEETKITVGRIVHFAPYGYPEKDLRAAVVTRVSDDTVVDLCVFSPNGIEFVKDVNKGDREGQWDYPERV